MTNLHQLLLDRHSIRRYKPETVDADSVRIILEAALLAPSSKSARPWQFIVVEDKDVLDQLSQCKPAGARPIANAAFAVVVIADPDASDVYIEDAAVATTLMHLQAADLGIGSCWIQIRNRLSADGQPAEEMIQRLLGIPQHLPVLTVITFGISDEQRKSVDPSKLLWEKVHVGTWKEQ